MLLSRNLKSLKRIKLNWSIRSNKRLANRKCVNANCRMKSRTLKRSLVTSNSHSMQHSSPQNSLNSKHLYLLRNIITLKHSMRNCNSHRHWIRREFCNLKMTNSSHASKPKKQCKPSKHWDRISSNWNNRTSRCSQKRNNRFTLLKNESWNCKKIMRSRSKNDYWMLRIKSFKRMTALNKQKKPETRHSNS